MADGILLDNDVIFDNDNDPLSGGSVTVYETGTTTLVTLYSDAAGTTPTTNPIEVDGSGRAPKVFVTTTSTLDAVIRDANGALIRTVTSIARVGQAANSADNVSITPIVGINDPATWVSGDPKTGTPAADVQTGLEAMAARFTPITDFMEFDFLTSASATTGRTALGLGTFAVLDEADRTLSQSVWDTGTSTTEGLISPAKLDSKITTEFTAKELSQSVWNTGTSTTEAVISPAKLEAKIDDNVDARVLAQSAWNTGTSTTEATITPAKLQAKLANFTDAIQAASSGQLALSPDSNQTWTHNFGAPANIVNLEIVCTTNDGTFTAGDRMFINPATNFHSDPDTIDTGVSIENQTNSITVYFGEEIEVLTFSGAGAPFARSIDMADWELVIHAIRF